MKKRDNLIPNWYLDMSEIIKYWDGSQRVYHHTAPINMMYALYQGLYDLLEEGIDNAIKRHYDAHLLLEKRLNENIGDAMLHAAISRVYLQLGLLEDALKSAQLSVALVPPSRDAWYGIVNKTNLAFIYLSSDLINDAIHTLKEVYNKPFGPKKTQLLLYWEWEKLRMNSRFKTIINNTGN